MEPANLRNIEKKYGISWKLSNTSLEVFQVKLFRDNAGNQTMESTFEKENENFESSALNQKQFRFISVSNSILKYLT